MLFQPFQAFCHLSCILTCIHDVIHVDQVVQIFSLYHGSSCPFKSCYKYLLYYINVVTFNSFHDSSLTVYNIMLILKIKHDQFLTYVLFFVRNNKLTNGTHALNSSIRKNATHTGLNKEYTHFKTYLH